MAGDHKGAARPPYPFVEFEYEQGGSEVVLVLRIGLTQRDAGELAQMIQAAVEAARQWENPEALPLPDPVVAERERILALLEAQLSAQERWLPDAHGGKFTKQYVRNTLRSLRAQIKGAPTLEELS